jgi:hypothetical protein
MNFKPSVTGEALGENWRSYRRGCERRFASQSFPSSDRCHFAVTVAIRINCYNFYIGQSRGNRIASLPSINGIGIELTSDI